MKVGDFLEQWHGYIVVVDAKTGYAYVNTTAPGGGDYDPVITTYNVKSIAVTTNTIIENGVFASVFVAIIQVQ